VGPVQSLCYRIVRSTYFFCEQYLLVSKVSISASYIGRMAQQRNDVLYQLREACLPILGSFIHSLHGRAAFLKPVKTHTTGSFYVTISMKRTSRMYTSFQVVKGSIENILNTFTTAFVVGFAPGVVSKIF
jgi:hypothetical protein